MMKLSGVATGEPRLIIRMEVKKLKLYYHITNGFTTVKWFRDRTGAMKFLNLWLDFPNKMLGGEGKQ